jgi:hypothetical protein
MYMGLQRMSFGQAAFCEKEVWLTSLERGKFHGNVDVPGAAES